jgi:hypothetical protein
MGPNIFIFAPLKWGCFIISHAGRPPIVLFGLFVCERARSQGRHIHDMKNTNTPAACNLYPCDERACKQLTLFRGYLSQPATHSGTISF